MQNFFFSKFYYALNSIQKHFFSISVMYNTALIYKIQQSFATDFNLFTRDVELANFESLPLPPLDDISFALNFA